MSKFYTLKHWYEHYERRISIASLLLGFVVDSLTLERVDAWRENLWILGNLLVAAVVIVKLHRRAGEDSGFWLPNILQFSFGALLGSFFIFYFKSTTISATWPFLAVLLLAMIFNEFFQKKYEKLTFQLSFLYFSIFSFTIFLTPLLVKKIGPEVFLLSGFLGLFIIWVYLHILRALVREKFLENRTHIWVFVLAIFAGVNLLYFTNLIPPIPLSLKDSGVYHSVERNSDGNYAVLEEEKNWRRFLTFHPKIHWVNGETLYAYTAIFAPGSIASDVIHNWQYRNEDGKWVSVTRTPLHLAGGRSGGFRTYSEKVNFTPGLWRVDVETPSGQIVGRLSFEIVPVETSPTLVPLVKQ